MMDEFGNESAPREFKHPRLWYFSAVNFVKNLKPTTNNPSPTLQKRLIEMANRAGKVVITATKMLESMIENPHPTRAEITDVANAVYEQADAIMLSGETTVGKYPVKCVEVFDRIARRIERSGNAGYHERAELSSPRQKLVKSAVVMADQLRAEAVIVFTRRGSMARWTSWLRPRFSPIYAVCETWPLADSLALNWGITPVVFAFDYNDPERNIDVALAQMKAAGILHRGHTVVIISAMSSGEQIVDTVQMRVME